MATENTIVLTKAYAVFEDRRKAGAAISPGALLEIDANDDFIPHSEAGGNATPVFARENSLLGKGLDADIVSGDQVPAAYMQAGGLVVGRLDASSTDAAAGDPLESAGNGNLRVHIPQVDLGAGEDVNVSQIVGYAEEDLAAPASGSSFIRLRT